MAEWYDCRYCGKMLVLAGGNSENSGWVDGDDLKRKCKANEENGVHLPGGGGGGGGGGSSALQEALRTFVEDPKVAKRIASQKSHDAPPRRGRSRSTDGPQKSSQDDSATTHESGNGQENKMALTGAIVREQREKLGWKRPLLAEKSGLTIAQIAGIETGRALKDGEEDKLRAALQLGVEDQVAPNGTVREPSNNPTPQETDPLVFTGENPEYKEKLDTFIEENKKSQVESIVHEAEGDEDADLSQFDDLEVEAVEL